MNPSLAPPGILSTDLKWHREGQICALAETVRPLEKQGLEPRDIGVGGQLHGTQRDSVVVPIRRHDAPLVFRRGPGGDGRRPVSAAGQQGGDELEGRAGGRRPDGQERRKEETTLLALRSALGGYGGRGTRELRARSHEYFLGRE